MISDQPLEEIKSTFCAGTGYKIDAIARCDKVSYCVWDTGYRKEGEWALNVNSVIVFGRISLVTDEEKRRHGSKYSGTAEISM